VGHVDAVLAQLVVQVQGPVAQARGGDVDVGQEGHGVDGAAPVGHQDRAAPGFDHVRDDLLDRVDPAVQVEVELGSECGGVDVQDARHAEVAVGGGELQDVDPSEALLDVGEGAGDRVGLSDVGGEACGFDALVPQLGCERVELGGVAGDQCDGEALGAEGAGDLDAQAGSGSDDGDDRHGWFSSARGNVGPPHGGSNTHYLCVAPS
jgi:hypothetical protein